jgi:hypothetical protein
MKTMVPLRRNGTITGLNLDGFRTCGAEGPGIKVGSSCRRQGMRIDAAAPCDTDQCGGDNGLALLAGGLDELFLGGVEVATTTGLNGVIVYLADYNGLANDREVTAGLSLSGGIFADLGCDGQPRGRTPSTFTNSVGGPDGGLALAYPSTFDGCDRWSIDPADATLEPDGTLKPKRSVRAYVRDNTLVVLGTDTTPFALGDRAVDVNSPVITARLDAVTTDAGTKASQISGATMFGRMTVGQLLPLAGSFKFDKVTLACKQRALYEAVALQLCGAVDVARTASLDGQDAPCDSVSFGLATELEPVVPMFYPEGYALRSRVSGCPEGTLLTEAFCSAP